MNHKNYRNYDISYKSTFHLDPSKTCVQLVWNLKIFSETTSLNDLLVDTNNVNVCEILLKFQIFSWSSKKNMAIMGSSCLWLVDTLNIFTTENYKSKWLVFIHGLLVQIMYLCFLNCFYLSISTSQKIFSETTSAMIW